MDTIEEQFEEMDGFISRHDDASQIEAMRVRVYLIRAAVDRFVKARWDRGAYLSPAWNRVVMAGLALRDAEDKLVSAREHSTRAEAAPSAPDVSQER